MSVTASSVRRRPQCCSSGVLHLRLSFVLEGSRPSFTSSTHPSLLVKGGAQAALEPLLPSVSPSRPSTDWEEHENPSLQEMDEDVKLRWGNRRQLPDGGPDPSAEGGLLCDVFSTIGLAAGAAASVLVELVTWLLPCYCSVYTSSARPLRSPSFVQWEFLES